jgi:hypothetical protein
MVKLRDLTSKAPSLLERRYAPPGDDRQADPDDYNRRLPKNATEEERKERAGIGSGLHSTAWKKTVAARKRKSILTKTKGKAVSTKLEGIVTGKRVVIELKLSTVKSAAKKAAESDHWAGLKGDNKQASRKGRQSRKFRKTEMFGKRSGKGENTQVRMRKSDSGDPPLNLKGKGKGPSKGYKGTPGLHPNRTVY